MLWLFSSPKFPDEEQTQKARWLHIVLWVGILVVTSFVAFNLFIAPSNWIRWLTIIFIVDTCSVSMFFLNRRGFTHLASILLIISIWLMVAWLAFTAGGLFAPAMTAYFFMVPLSSLLLGRKAAIYSGVGFVATATFMYLASITGIMPDSMIRNQPLLIFLADIIFMIVVVASQVLSTTAISKALIQARQELTERKIIETALRKNEVRIQMIVENAPVAIEISRIGERVFSNPAYCKMWGYQSMEELQGRSVLEQIAPRSRETVTLRNDRRRQGLPVAGEIDLYGLRKDGTEFPIHLATTDIMLDNERISVAFFTDMTSQKAAEAGRQERLDQAEMLATISQALASASLDFQAGLDVIVRELTHRIGDTCAVFLIEEDRQSLSMASMYHPNQMARTFSQDLLAHNQTMPVGVGMIGRVAQTGQAEVLNDAPIEQLKEALSPQMVAYQEQLGIRSVMVVPMRAQGGITGVLGLIRHRTSQPYSPEDQALVQELADRAGMTMTNARLYAENLSQAEELRLANAELEQRIFRRTAELADLYNNAPCGYQSLDENGCLTMVNDTWCHMLGYQREEIIGQPYVKILTPEFQKVFRAGFPKFKEEGSFPNIEHDMVRKDGSIISVLISGVAEMDAAGRFVRSRATIVDNTERKKAEIQINALNEKLIERAQKLEEGNKELESFSYSVSHDLKAPLRGINGYSHLLLEEYADRLDDDGRACLQAIRQSANQMGQLIDDLLTYARLDRHPITQVAFELTDFVAEQFDLFAEEIKTSSIAVTISLPEVTLETDQEGLGLVLRNIIDNAIKYSHTQQEPRIEIGGEIKDHTCLMWIKDNGVGFDMKYQDQIFDIFERLHSSVDFPGTGVGLAIVRKSMQRIGGKVWAESTEGEGAAFYLELPAWVGNT